MDNKDQKTTKTQSEDSDGSDHQSTPSKGQTSFSVQVHVETQNFQVQVQVQSPASDVKIYVKSPLSGVKVQEEEEASEQKTERQLGPVCLNKKGPVFKLKDNHATFLAVHEKKNVQVEININSDQQEHTVTLEDSVDSAVKKDTLTQPAQALLDRLLLNNRSEYKLTSAELLQIGPPLKHDQDLAEGDLFIVYLHKLLMLDYRARYIWVKDQSNDISTKVYSSSPKYDNIHPMDCQMAVFHCSDSFLKQKLVTKLSQCQYALPLLVPDPSTEDIECPLWTLRQIQKTWTKTQAKDNSQVVTKPICKAQTLMVFCFRLGSLSVSKSELINTLINDRHNTFYHRSCPGSTKSCLLFDGVAEIAWYCPAGKPNDTFNDCVAFCNLHGDGVTHDKQLNILMDKSSVNVVFVPTLRKDHVSAEFMTVLLESPKPLIVLLEDSNSCTIQLKKGKYKVGIKDRGQSDVSEELKSILRDILSGPCESFQLESMSNTGIRVDEEDPCCSKGLSAAKEVMNTIQRVNVMTIKSNLLPCQGRLLQDWCRINKEQYCLQGDIEKERCKKQNELLKLREDQCKASSGDLMKTFVRHLSSLSPTESEYYLTWTQILMDAHVTENVSSIQQSYKQKCAEVLALKRRADKSSELKSKQAELEQISSKLQSATFGLEHIFREMEQIYEAHKSLNKQPNKERSDWSRYPELAAELMISGHPMELMDGDAGHIPLIWISSLIDQVIHKLGDKRVFVLSVLGIQGSGKTTMLNAMFGLQFAVSAGRCTKGAFMQLVKLSEDFKRDFQWDYILVVDTEGLRALESEGNGSVQRDNELATFAVGVGNMTLVNIFGENPSEMQDVLQILVQAFMRMKKVKLSPSCVFVHKNVTDVGAAEKNMERKRKLKETLDQIVKVAAREEVCDAVSFSDIIEFDIEKDVKYFAELWEGSPPMAPPNPGYSVSVQDLKKFILSKASQSSGVTLSEFKIKVQDLWNALLNENFVFSFKNTIEISAYRRLEVEFGNWTWALRSEMLNIEKQLHTSIENGTVLRIDHAFLLGQISRKYEEIKAAISQYFDRKEQKDLLTQWKNQHEQKIKDFCDEIVRRTQRNLSDFLEEKKRNEKLNEKKIILEDQLHQQCKELAHQVKINMKDGDLEKQFHSLWQKYAPALEEHVKCVKKINLERDQNQVLQEFGFEFTLIITRKNSKCYTNLSKLEDYSDYVEQKGNHKTKQNITEFIHTVQEEAEEIIKSKPVATKGYNTNYLREMAQHVNTSVKEFQTKWKYSLKQEFTIDLTLYVFVSTETWISESHEKFMKTETHRYLERKKQEHYTVFSSFCKGESSAVVLAEMICEKLKASMTETVCNRTAIDVAEVMRTSYPAFNASRLNLEKHVLKSLAEKGDFNRYMTYIENPKTYIELFIKEEVQDYIHREKNVQILLKKNVDEIKNHVTIALIQATEKVKEGNIEVWLQEFHSLLREKLNFGQILAQNFKSVTAFSFLKEAIEKRLCPITEDLKNLPLDKMNEFRLHPDQILIDQLCNCCWETCPFCAAVCLNTVKDHSPDKHSVLFHRPTGIEGWHIRGTVEMVIDFCTTLVASDKKFRPQSFSHVSVPYKKYQSASGNYAEWLITPDGSKLVYWKWFICRFQKELEDYHNLKFVGQGEIPSEWRNYSREEAIQSLNEICT
ncbi:interferon-induced very large GTPase 1-like [Boleophthalmus pectinirostris]|uniref:interferon-induced very large GTPase 1-like n=1 Tax=Boleophthalmus pectinirostris TaxID=150288 RepID=UPI00242A4D56|nr:interferon-induced very large GTPase 1-like [Boleophthalmus pectinirostris]